MAAEPRRRCGYRKVGGLYLVAPGAGQACGRLPHALTVCRTCGHGIKQTLGWTWVDAGELIGPALVEEASAEFGETRMVLRTPCEGIPNCENCPLRRPETMGRAGLLWVGTMFYKTPQEFVAEANALGISKRIATVPHGFKLGETWVLLAHPRAIQTPVTTEDVVAGRPVFIPGIFRVFVPAAVEKIVTETQAQDREEMGRLEKRGITPVAVPDNDLDHQGSIYQTRPVQITFAEEAAPVRRQGLHGRLREPL